MTNKKIINIKSNAEKTQAFTFEVKMLVQVFGNDAAKAKEQLDAQGGYVTRRDVELIESVELYNGENK